MNRLRLRGQAMVEFALAGIIVLFMIFGIVAFAFSSWQRSAIDYELSSLADELPGDWSALSDDQLVRYLILDNSQLDPDRLRVLDCSVETSYEVEVNADDPVALAVGSRTSTTAETWVTVEATITYDVSSPIVLTDQDMTYERQVSGSYLVERRYEVS